MTTDLETVGTEITKAPVTISYKIIEPLSLNLFAEPNRAIGELIANSFDAFATQCVVNVPLTRDGIVWIWDNGESMDSSELGKLWMIAKSHKRNEQREALAKTHGRYLIGKSGIGKLAGYTIGRRMTHICKKGGEYHCLTMDYQKILMRDEDHPVELPVRRLTRVQVVQAIPFVMNYKLNGRSIGELDDSCNSWTTVLADHLRERFPVGGTSWISPYSLPPRTDFRIWLNGQEVGASNSPSH